jgi:hypothetical protein
MSVNSKNGFSLNGTHRNQGYVGQTSLSRSLPKTPMKGNVAIGHGGCCGKFILTPIVQSAVTSQEDSTVVKKSVINTMGLIQTKINCTGYGDRFSMSTPRITVKPDNNQNNKSQSSSIAILAKNEKRVADACHVTKPISQYIRCNNPDITLTHTRNSCGLTTKDEGEYVAISSGKYITKKHDQCVENDIPYIPTSSQRTPIP